MNEPDGSDGEHARIVITDQNARQVVSDGAVFGLRAFDAASENLVHSRSLDAKSLLEERTRELLAHRFIESSTIEIASGGFDGELRAWSSRGTAAMRQRS
jgi:hypothetical protein